MDRHWNIEKKISVPNLEQVLRTSSHSERWRLHNGWEVKTKRIGFV